MNFSVYITPVFITAVILAALVKKIPLYDTLVQGAKEGMEIVWNIFPAMIMILTAVSMLNASGVLDFLVRHLAGVTQRIGIPSEVMPMALIRPVSGSGALGVLADNLKQYGPDSKIGMISSVIMGSTETTFYTLAVYFSSTTVKNVRRAIPCALIGDIIGVIAACLLIGKYF